jgi:hypothetical protein
MSRTKKETVQAVQSEDIAMVATTIENVQENAEIPAIEKLVSVCNGNVKYPAYNEELRYFNIYSDDIELHKGRIVYHTGLLLKEGVRAMVVPFEDNARYGLYIECGRCLNSDVITQLVTPNEEIKVVLNINDEVMITEQGTFGSRTRFSHIPAGTPIARVVFL